MDKMIIKNNAPHEIVSKNSTEDVKILETITTGFLKFRNNNADLNNQIIEVPCAVVKDGYNIIRVVESSGLFKSFGRTSHGAKRIPGLPSVVGGKKLASLISDEEIKLLQPIKYLDGHERTGYNAEALIVITRAYMKAEELGILKPQQIPALKQAKSILLDLAGQRIRDIIDKATGFFYEEEINALDSLIKRMYLNDEPLRKITQRFPREFYQEVFRIHGWKFNARTSKRPGYVGTFTNKYVYNLLPDTVMNEIKSRNPTLTDKEYHYKKNKYYHFLTIDTGIKELDEILKKIIIVMKLSTDKKNFQLNYQKAFENEISNKNVVRPLQLATISNLSAIE